MRSVSRHPVQVLAATLACFLCLFYVGAWGFDIRGHRPWVAAQMNLPSAYGQTSRFLPMAAMALLGGFRGFAADLLWLKADDYWHHGQWQRLLPLYHLISALQPRFTVVWSVGGWHMAYNLSDRARKNPDYSPAQRELQARRWVYAGIRFLENGLRYNEDKPDLYFDLGWTYFDKVKDYPAAIYYLDKAARKSDTLLTLRTLAHAYEKAGQDRQALSVWEFLDKRGDSVAKRFLPRLRAKVR